MSKFGRECEFRAAKQTAIASDKNCGVPPVWHPDRHSLPLVGVEQRCGSAALTVGYIGQGG